MEQKAKGERRFWSLDAFLVRGMASWPVAVRCVHLSAPRPLLRVQALKAAQGGGAAPARPAPKAPAPLAPGQPPPGMSMMEEMQWKKKQRALKTGGGADDRPPAKKLW